MAEHHRPVARPRLRRDRLTLAVYAHFVAWGWYLFGFAPAVPVLAEEQGISRGQAGLHGTAMATGTTFAGLITAHLSRRYGRRFVLFAGSGSLGTGVLVLGLGHVFPLTVTGCFLASTGGSLMVSAAQPALTVHHHATSTAAITEANALATMFGLLAPLAVGGSVALGWGWRPALMLTVALAAVSSMLLWQVRAVRALAERTGLPRATRTADGGGHGPSDELDRTAPFPATFWLFWIALITAVALEHASTYWTAAVLVQRTGLEPGMATAAVSALVAGMCVARFVVGPVSLHKAPEKLLMLSFGVAIVGWAMFWTTTSTAVAIVGLVVTGMGYGGMYPLAIVLVMRASLGRPDQAQARASMGVGIAVGLAPFTLGAVSDQVGAHTAFILVPVLALVGLAAATSGLRGVRRMTARSRPAS